MPSKSRIGGNVSEAVDKTVTAHHACVRSAMTAEPAAVLHTELAALEFSGSVQTICGWLHLSQRAARPTGPRPTRPSVPKPRRITRWIMTGPQHLASDEQSQLTAVLASCAEPPAAAGHVRTSPT
jgi:hypothetical protein